MPIPLPFFTLLLLISFASVNAVLFTPALPNIAHFFNITDGVAEKTITWFLIGYTLGQLLYGPIANRFGRKPALFFGVSLQIISSILCVFAGFMHTYWLLILGRFFLALGSGVGLKMTFTLVNECYEPKLASQKIAYLMLAFAIIPGLSVALGGLLITYFDWTSCFYAGGIYGFILLFLISKLPETKTILDLKALQFDHLLQGYIAQFKNLRLVSGGLLMGSTGSFIYLFATIAPFVAINYFNITTAEYGLANLLPPIGLIIGSLIGAQLTNHYSLTTLVKIGITIASLGVLLMLIATALQLSALVSLFLPMIIIYFGLSLILPNASTMAMTQVEDKAHGAAVMSFLNMGLVTLSVLCIGYFAIGTWLLPTIYLLLCMLMTGLFLWLKRE